jgi:hypothetical protein
MQEGASRLIYTKAFQTGRRDLEVFVQNVESQKQTFQHRGFDLRDSVSYYTTYIHHQHSICIPRNSTQLISMSSRSPDADKGRSSSRVRSINGPVFVVVNLVRVASPDSCSAIVTRAPAQHNHFIISAVDRSSLYAKTLYIAADGA